MKIWNRNNFGHVQSKIKEISRQIEELQIKPQPMENLEEEGRLQLELDELLEIEEIIWRDKVKGKWLEEGDANTRFFHLSTIIHQRHNAIHYIKKSDNSWVCDSHVIGDYFVHYCTHLFSAGNVSWLANFGSLI